ncbi:addiction module antidote protein [Frateuria terrea]|uniref:Probable addiction module antidote protein n=1 Tax=Frateuria terrea TaxID=529704 RepID=A0A1H6QB72_9GAMM|nr:addiction module antidote protein [Frateuria terrea]SEI38064.1 probable addiction module antidote protein [Frateuria terrea]SFP03619.1 probable addiction module antidote protein [Frateuria terrea]
MTLQLTTFDMADHLDSEEAIAEYLSRVMADGDDDELLRALGHVAKARGMAQLAKDAGVGRESLYKALKPGASPGYAAVGKVVRALGFRMTLQPIARKAAASAKKTPKKLAKPKTPKTLAGTAAKRASAAGQ